VVKNLNLEGVEESYIPRIYATHPRRDPGLGRGKGRVGLGSLGAVLSRVTKIGESGTSEVDTGRLARGAKLDAEGS